MKQRVHYLLYIIKLILNHWGNTDFPLGFKECSTEKRKGEEKKKKERNPKILRHKLQSLSGGQTATLQSQIFLKTAQKSKGMFVL